VWGSDVTSIDTPFEAGLGFAVRMDKGDFIGRDALEAAQAPSRRLVGLVLDDPRVIALGSEPVRVEGRSVGRVTSGGYGYTVGHSLAYAYLPIDDAVAGRRVEVVVFGRAVGAEVTTEPFFDPTNSRVHS
jgi:4-methylaminobutanoate oxidase (formaldehyde-forming)